MSGKYDELPRSEIEPGFRELTFSTTDAGYYGHGKLEVRADTGHRYRLVARQDGIQVKVRLVDVTLSEISPIEIAAFKLNSQNDPASRHNLDMGTPLPRPPASRCRH